MKSHKVYFAIALILAIVLPFAFGAITATNLTPYPVGFAVNATSADASGCEELKAAPGSGKYHYIDQVAINCASGITVTIGAAENSGAVKTVLIGPITFTAAGTNYMHWEFMTPLQVPDNNSITVDASGAGAVQVFVAGKTR